MQRSVDGHFGEVEPDDLVVSGDRFGGQRSEHPDLFPLVAPAAQRGLRGPRILPATSQLHPVTRRMRIPQKHRRSVVLGLWQPSG